MSREVGPLLLSISACVSIQVMKPNTITTDASRTPAAVITAVFMGFFIDLTPAWSLEANPQWAHRVGSVLSVGSAASCFPSFFEREQDS